MAGLPGPVSSAVGCLVMASLLSRCTATMEMEFTEDSQFVNKTMTGDAVVTYNDVTAGQCSVHCMSKFPCGTFAYNREEKVCTLLRLSGNFSLVDAPGFQLYVATRGPVESSGQKLCPLNLTTPTACWTSTPGLFRHVSVGPSGVAGIDTENCTFFRNDTFQEPLNPGLCWLRSPLECHWSQLDVGTDMFVGTKSNDDSPQVVSVNSTYPLGKGMEGDGPPFPLRWVTVSPGDSLWGRDTQDQVVRFQFPIWNVTDGPDMNIQSVDAGLAGVWVVNSTGQLLHRLGTYGDTGSEGTGWRALEGTFRSVASGKNVVVAAALGGQVWLRVGVGPHTPTGLAWLRFPGSLHQVDVYQTEEGVAIWGVDFSGKVCFTLLCG